MSSSLEHIAPTKDSIVFDEVIAEYTEVQEHLATMRAKLAVQHESIARLQARIDATSRKIAVAREMLEKPETSHEIRMLASQFLKSEARFPVLLKEALAGLTLIEAEFAKAEKIAVEIDERLEEHLAQETKH
jgi:Tfp pilus assembly protein FimV